MEKGRSERMGSEEGCVDDSVVGSNARVRRRMSSLW